MVSKRILARITQPRPPSPCAKLCFVLLPPRLRLRKIIILVLLPKPDRRKIDFAIRNPLLHLAAQIKKRAHRVVLHFVIAIIEQTDQKRRVIYKVTTLSKA
jgi:hypothetical protein